MNLPAPFAFLGMLVLLSACSPSLNQVNSGSESGQGSLSLQCTGKSYGTITAAVASLSLNVLSNGVASGTFTNNGTSFRAEGVVPGRMVNHSYFIDAVNVQLDSRISGGVNGLLGFKPVGIAGAYGSTGTLNGTVDSTGTFKGFFKGIQGNYRTEMVCNHRLPS